MPGLRRVLKRREGWRQETSKRSGGLERDNATASGEGHSGVPTDWTLGGRLLRVWFVKARERKSGEIRSVSGWGENRSEEKAHEGIDARQA